MTSVLKMEGAAGERYESLYDGAKSLVNGLGSMLRVAARGARAYNSQSQGNFQIKATFLDEYQSRKRRRVTIRSRTSLLYSSTRRTLRDANDAQLQVKNCSKILVHNLTANLQRFWSVGYDFCHLQVILNFSLQRLFLTRIYFNDFPLRFDKYVAFISSGISPSVC